MLLRERNPEQEGDAMGGKKDIPRTVRLDEDLDAWALGSRVRVFVLGLGSHGAVAGRASNTGLSVDAAAAGS